MAEELSPDVLARDRQWLEALFPHGNGKSHIEEQYNTPETYALLEAARRDHMREDAEYWGSREAKYTKRKRKLKKAEARIARLQEKIADRERENRRLHCECGDRLNDYNDLHNYLFKANEQLTSLIGMVDKLGEHEIALPEAVALRQEIERVLNPNAEH